MSLYLLTSILCLRFSKVTHTFGCFTTLDGRVRVTLSQLAALVASLHSRMKELKWSGWTGLSNEYAKLDWTATVFL